MVCARCKGLMVEHPLSERDGQHVGRQWAPQQMMWRCLICGDRIDKVIMEHRAFTQIETSFQQRARVWQKLRTA